MRPNQIKMQAMQSQSSSEPKPKKSKIQAPKQGNYKVHNETTRNKTRGLNDDPRNQKKFTRSQAWPILVK